MGTWQTDPELQRLRRAVLAEGQVAPVGRALQAPSARMRALMTYINQRGSQLGIPAGYTVDIDTNQLKKEAGIPWRQIGLTSVGMLAGAAAVPALFGSAAPAAGQAAGAGAGAGTTAAAEGLIPATFASPAGMYPAAVESGIWGTGASGAGAGLGGVAAGAGVGGALKDFITDPRNIATLATTIPALVAASGESGSDSALADPTVQQLLQMSLQRQQRADPLHESVTNLSMAMLPTAYQTRR